MTSTTNTQTEVCTHPDEERFTRYAHGYLGDAPRGTVEFMCAGCGAVLGSVDVTDGDVI